MHLIKTVGFYVSECGGTLSADDINAVAFRWIQQLHNCIASEAQKHSDNRKRKEEENGRKISIKKLVKR